MRCMRCSGLMVTDHCYDLLEGGGPFRIRVWRCLCCGDILDPLILKNRQVRVH